MQNTLDPEDCTTMIEVRAGVDAVDAAMVDMLVKRFGYMRAASRIKLSEDAVRDEDRKAQVIANVRALALAADLPEAVIAELWDLLIERSIAYELEHFQARSR